MSSQALMKRSQDAALMPPPPAPKRIKRPTKVLDEDDYTDALSHIIARDFFPGLIETEAQQEYINALDSQDQEWIASAGRKLTEVMTPGPNGRRSRGRRGTSMTPAVGAYGRGGETPTTWQGDTPMSVASSEATNTGEPKKAEIDTNMSLGAFQAKYTSEDNESFYKLLDKQNIKRSEKYAWMWAGNKIPAARQIAHRKREARLLADKAQASSESKDLAKIGSADDRKAMPDSWKSRPDNPFMFEPSSIEDTHQTVQQKAEEISRAPPKAVVYDNTRLPASTSSTNLSLEPPPSPSLSAVQDAIAGRPRSSASEAAFGGASTPRVNGYAFVDSAPSPSPSELTLSWGSSDHSSLLGSGDATPNPFKIKDSSKREALHHRMVDKVARSKRAVGKREGELAKTPVPRFASSPTIAKGGLTPAAQKLLGRVGGGAKTPSLWEGRGGQSVRRSGLRQVTTALKQVDEG
ncbi:hypothetical protein G7Y79_00050g085350 [Physcia stellaris]|nr:hypothetical protein G7Y79_00050g085350 [Physcia stellaris]